MKNISPTLNHTDTIASNLPSNFFVKTEEQKEKDGQTNLHGYGHSAGDVHGSTAAFVFLGTIFGFMAVIYMIYKVYK